MGRVLANYRREGKGVERPLEDAPVWILKIPRIRTRITLGRMMKNQQLNPQETRVSDMGSADGHLRRSSR